MVWRRVVQHGRRRAEEMREAGVTVTDAGPRLHSAEAASAAVGIWAMCIGKKLHCGRPCNPPRTHQPSAVTIASLFDIATSSCTFGKCVCESMNHLAKYARSGWTSTDVADQ